MHCDMIHDTVSSLRRKIVIMELGTENRSGDGFLGSNSIVVLLMDKILHYPLQGIYHNSHSLGSLGSCRILSISRSIYGSSGV